MVFFSRIISRLLYLYCIVVFLLPKSSSGEDLINLDSSDTSSDIDSSISETDKVFENLVKESQRQGHSRNANRTGITEVDKSDVGEVVDSSVGKTRALSSVASSSKASGQNRTDNGKSKSFNFPKTQGELSSMLSDGDANNSVASQGAESGKSSSSSTFLNVKDAEISALVKTFSKITKRNFVVDSDVKGKITIHLPSPVSEEEALRIFDSVLLLKGFTTVPIGDNVWKVVAAKDAKNTTIPMVSDVGPRPTDTLVTQLLRMKYISADEMQKVLSQFVSKDGLVTAFTGTNSLIVIDSAANISRLLKLIKELDIPAVDQDLTIIPIKHAEANDIAEKILKILQDDEDKSQGNSQPKSPPAIPTHGTRSMMGQTASAGSSVKVGARSLPLKIIPDERTNSIIVVADPEMAARVEALVKQLDSPLDLSGGRFHVYKLKHSKAEETAQMLNALVSGGGSTYSPQKKSKGSSISRSNSSRNRKNSYNQNGYGAGFNESPSYSQPSQSSAQMSSSSGSGQQKGAGKGIQTGRVTFEGEVSIAPDTSTNSLIINASRSDFQKLSEVLEIIDARRRQVIVEATILEVTLSKQSGLGSELQGTLGAEEGGIFGQTNFGGLTNLLTDPKKLSDLTIAAASSGTLTLPGGIKIPSQAVLISALSQMSNVNVLSSPTILTTDNEEAEIVVGENVPFVTGVSQNTSNLNNTFNQVDRQDVGITLRITPQISTEDFVTLSIFVEISNVVQATRNDEKGPTTTVRTAETVVEVKNKQMIVTGGLISDSVVEAVRGIPFLQDIPVLGQLFERKDTDLARTNLLIFLTPRIIVDQYEARDTAIEARDTMERAIEGSNLGPDRSEFLRSQRFDNVFEVVPTEGRSNTTNKGAGASFGEMSTITPPVLHSDSKLSNEASDKESDVKKIESNLASDIKAKTVRDYFVFKSKNSKNKSKSKLIGVSAIPLLDAKSSGFFQIGKAYSRHINKDGAKTDASYTCVGKYDSLKAAIRKFPALSNKSQWQNLSRSETQSLGKLKHGMIVSEFRNGEIVSSGIWWTAE